MQAIDRKFVIASASSAGAVARIAADAPVPIDLVVTSPTALAREAAATAVDGRWVFTTDEPLLARCLRGETGDDVLARFAQALRGVVAYRSSAPLVICDSLDVLGASVFVFDENGVMSVARGLDTIPPLP